MALVRYLTALTIAIMPALIGSGNFVQAAMSVASSEAALAACWQFTPHGGTPMSTTCPL